VKIITNPSDFIPHILAAYKALSDRKEEVNRLNVFPVPDGDTGTNMSLTMEAVIKELLALPQNTSNAEICKSIVHGSLMGARGNSGVITSQILRGICDSLVDHKNLTIEVISKALDKSVEVSFSAVRKPVEGTMLTVLRDVADAARAAVGSQMTIRELLIHLKDVSYRSVRNTPELLPILKENGVVDAGGYGLALLIDGFVSSITGETSVELELGFDTTPSVKIEIEQIDDWEGSEYLYCTEFLFLSEDLDVAAARDFLISMGDCELLVGAHPDFKIHVHTNEPGSVLSYMTARGQVSEVHIHNMRLQSESRLTSLQDSAQKAVARDIDEDAVIKKNYASIAVASGSGMERILKSLGITTVVSGGQTMNPSTQDILNAIEKVKTDKVFVFPNNKNIVMSANVAAQASSKQVKVIPTTSVPQSFSALFILDQEADFEENAQNMIEAIQTIRTGEITTAIKDAKTPNGKVINGGNVIGLIDDVIEVVGDEIHDTTLELVTLLANDEVDTLTILAGEDLSQEYFESILESLEEKFPELEIDAHRGEQPLYPLVMSVE